MRLWPRRLRGGADVVGIRPSPEFVPPNMNLDGPPSLTGAYDDNAGFHYHEPPTVRVPVAYFPADSDGYWTGPALGLDFTAEDVIPELTEGMRVSIDGRLFTVASALPGGHYILEEVTDGRT